jgi:hypothetical protein
MWIQAGALSPVPTYAVLADDALKGVVQRLADYKALQQRLDDGFRQLEREQPALAFFLSGELTELELQPAQALAYFLFLLVFMAFREGFGARLRELAEDDIDAALEQLLLDGEVRSRTCRAQSYSEDAIALGQPALMRIVQGEIENAPEEAGELSPIVQAVLVEIVALTHAVAPTS